MLSPIVSRAGVFVVQRIYSQRIASGLGWKCIRIRLVMSVRHQPLKHLTRSSTILLTFKQTRYQNCQCFPCQLIRTLFSLSCFYLFIYIPIYFLSYNMAYGICERTLTLNKDITMTSQWTGCRLKSPGTRMFAQPFVQTQIKENIKATCHGPLWRECTGGRWFRHTKDQ